MCVRSRKVTLKNGISEEVNIPIGQIILGCVSLSIGKWIIVSQFLEFKNLSLLGTFIKYVRSKGEKGTKAKAYISCANDVILLFESVQRWRLPENHQIWARYFMDVSFPKFIYGHVAMLSIKIGIWYLWYSLYNIYTKFNVFYINSIQ